MIGLLHAKCWDLLLKWCCVQPATLLCDGNPLVTKWDRSSSDGGEELSGDRKRSWQNRSAMKLLQRLLEGWLLLLSGLGSWWREQASDGELTMSHPRRVKSDWDLKRDREKFWLLSWLISKCQIGTNNHKVEVCLALMIDR